MARTKIVCTIGPACQDRETLRAMIRAGMNVARINLSHGTHESHAAVIRDLRDVAREEGAVLPIMGDLQGPKIRLGKIRGGEVTVRAGDEIALTTREVPGDGGEVSLPHPDVVADLDPGQRLLIDDGQLEFTVLSRTATDLCCQVVTGGVLRSGKGVSVPGARLSTVALTAKDHRDLRFAVREGIDFVALSFVRGDRDVELLQRALEELGVQLPIIVKIEKPEALESFDRILERCDAVMIARGDLGVEIPAEQVPFTQKAIIRDCRLAAVPVITATQMLESMVRQPRPTRAEASDVANAILDGTSAVMLSGETAVGRYPVEAVKMMARIATHAESQLPGKGELPERQGERTEHTAGAIAGASVAIARDLGATAIVTCTCSGLTARLVASRRPRQPVLAITPSPEVHCRLALLWGVRPLLVPFYDTTDQMLEEGERGLLETGLARPGDAVVITAGVPPASGQPTNMVTVRVLDPGSLPNS